MLLNINATRGPTDCCSATHGLLLSEALGCGTRSPLYLIGDAASRRCLSRVGYFITLNGPLNGHPPSSILQELDIKRELLGHVRKHKLPYFGHLCRDHACQITKTVVEGYVEGRRRRGRPRKQYIDNIK